MGQMGTMLCLELNHRVLALVDHHPSTMRRSAHHKPSQKRLSRSTPFAKSNKAGVLTMTIFVSQGRYTHQAFEAMIKKIPRIVGRT
jgi:hypothetical protein